MPPRREIVGNLVSISDLTPDKVNALIDRALRFERVHTTGGVLPQTLKGKLQYNVFLAPSTRTHESFKIAGKRLGAEVETFDLGKSSCEKGESMAGTIRTLGDLGADVIVYRLTDGSERADLPRLREIERFKSSAVLVNAGTLRDHPTQALGDLLTIKKHVSKDLSQVKVKILNSSCHESRVARSQVELFTMMGINVYVESPPSWKQLIGRGEQKFVHGISNSSEPDILGLLRVPFCPPPEQCFDEIDRCRFFMHPGPLPYSLEVEGKLANHKKSLIKEQVRLGVYMRMACLEALLTNFSG